MTRISFLCLLIMVATAGMASSDKKTARDLYSDTWTATDALGRTMPDIDAVGEVKKDQRRIVGIFYVTWHKDEYYNLKQPYSADVSKILSEDPNARLDANHRLWQEGSYHWGEPEMGYFLSKDEYVIRKDMSMLADAGVDVLVMDVTNAVRYWDEWEALFPVMEKMKAEGNKVPKFCFWAFNGPVITVVQELYEKIYKANKYKDLWFMWDGKPLLLYNATPEVDANGVGVKNPNPNYDKSAAADKNNPHYGDPDYTNEFYTDYTKEVKKFFTLRNMWWGYYKWAGERFIGTEDNWSFGYDLGDKRVNTMKPDELVSKHKGKLEEAAITPAQHSSTMIGKSWTRETQEPKLNEYDLPAAAYVPWLRKIVENPEGYGIYFQQRWDEALQSNPQFLYINDWNEWIAGKYHPEAGKKIEFMGEQRDYFFVDQYNSEFNRTIQPMKNGYTDNYYMQMAQNIRRYKGVRPIPENTGFAKIKVDGNFKDWNSVKVEYRDTVGDVFHRDYNGYGGLHYTDNLGRNDIVTCKAAVDAEMIYFYAATNDNLTPHTDKNWMYLLIDADMNYNTGWYGYDFLVNKDITDNKITSIHKYIGNNKNGSWVKTADISYSYKGKELELSIPRHILGLKGNVFKFDFHWCDNPSELIDPISLCTAGDSAPNRRFNYRFIWNRYVDK